MILQEIADYLEDNNYPVNSSLEIKTKTTYLMTGVKGAYLWNAACILHLYKEEEVNKELLDRLIKQRKNAST